MIRPGSLGFIVGAALALAGCATEHAALPPPSCAVKSVSELPLTISGNLPLLHATIGTVDALMVLDTGADRLLLNESALGHLQMEADRHRPSISRGLNGSSVSYRTTIDRLILGSVDLGRREADSIPFPWPRPGTPPDGFLAGSILFIFDLDIDIAHRRLTLYMARDCPGGAPPWDDAYTTLEARPPLAGHAQLAVGVTLDGHDITATVDTGAEISVVSRRVAALAGVGDAQMTRDRSIVTQGFGPEASTTRLHRFGELRIAGETIRDPVMAVADLPAGAGDMLLGEDWLRSHRLWLSYVSRRIHVMTPRP